MPFNNWELEELLCFLQAIQCKRVIASQDDLMILKGVGDGRFSTSHLFNILDCADAIVFPHQFIWNTWVSTKVGFFAWEASWGRVLTLNNLKRRGRALANRCFLCGE